MNKTRKLGRVTAAVLVAAAGAAIGVAGASAAQAAEPSIQCDMTAKPDQCPGQG
ncbi:hypothetical protein [Salininema proteolyticum]|uniref:Uncharacterized protein n=1 Tax=Salininema proteolyticum TaxID=1607685 RepID=A0ABV8U3Q3_9ACTN